MLAPQSGLTHRSFSHHLALSWGSEIRSFWYPASIEPENSTLRLLILPWPLTIARASFREVPAKDATVHNLPAHIAFFEFVPAIDKQIVEDTLQELETAIEKRGRVDAVVFPESALTEEESDHLSNVLTPRGISLIAGVAGARNSLGTLENYACVNIPFGSHTVPLQQSKHHRWKLDSSQINTYGLRLSRRKQFWENIPIRNRSLAFVCLRDWLALCVLICEDLARPDPVGDLIRSVGPNLVVALLLDGPQLKTRWSARYAVTLADDPGSSVLALTCRGMASLSKSPTGKPSTNKGLVALWKDVRGPAREIDIGDSEVALLEIEVEEREEWTADGRSCGGVSGHPILKDVLSWKKKSKRVTHHG
jgi:hypothetical protein